MVLFFKKAKKLGRYLQRFPLIYCLCAVHLSLKSCFWSSQIAVSAENSPIFLVTFEQKKIFAIRNFAPMKKSSFSSYFLLGLTALSLFCYVFLHKVAYATTGHCPSSTTASVSDKLDDESSQILLPDVALVKRFITITKMVLTKD